MYLIQKAGKDGGIKEYLTKTEQEHLKKSQPSYLAYLEGNNLKNTAKNMNDYLKDKVNHEPARITGSLAKTFNLSYEKDGANAYSKMISGKFPGTAEEFKAIYGDQISLRKDNRLVKKYTNAGTGNSLVLAMPRSLSMVYSISDKEKQQKIRDCVNSVDLEMTKEIERLSRPADGKFYSKDEAEKLSLEGKTIDPKYVFDPEQTKCAFFEFYHYENRGIEPHLHKHKEQVPYAEFTMADGSKKIMVLDNKDILKNQKLLTANFNTLLVNKLETIELYTESAKEYGNDHSFIVKGITRQQEIDISLRRKELKESLGFENYEPNFMSAVKEERTKALETYRRKTAETKQGLNSDQIHSLIKDKSISVMGQEGLEHFKFEQHYGYSSRPKSFEQKNIIMSKEMSTAGEMTAENIKANISNELRFSKEFLSLSDLNKEINKEYKRLFESKELILKTNGKITSMEVVKNEYKSLGYAELLSKQERNHSVSITEKQKNHFERYKKQCIDNKRGLNSGQEYSCELIAKDKTIISITGDAGTGKTQAVIRYANKFNTAMGREVIGIATQSKTSKALQEAGIEKTSSIAGLLVKFTDKETGELNVEKVKAEFNNKSIIVDEAGMTSAHDYSKLLQMVAEGKNNSIILVGDTKQLNSVGYGDTLNIINKHIPEENQSRLWENMRQENGVAKRIAESFKDKNSMLAVNLMDENGLLHLSKENETRQDLINKLADRFVSTEGSKVAIAYKNEDCNLLNNAIRERIKEEQKKDVYSKPKIDFDNEYHIVVNKKGTKDVEEKSFAVNDQIIFTAPTKLSKKEEIMNAEQGVIKAIHERKDGVYLDVEVNGKLFSVNTEKHKDFNHSYAITSYSSQGITVDKAFVLADGTMNNNTAYVDFSRHKKEVEMYCEEKDLPSFIKNSNKESVKATTIDDENVKKALTEMVKYKKERFSDSIKPVIHDETQGQGEIESKLKPEDKEVEEKSKFTEKENEVLSNALSVLEKANQSAEVSKFKEEPCLINEQKTVLDQKTIFDLKVIDNLKTKEQIRLELVNELQAQVVRNQPKPKGMVMKMGGRRI